MRESFLHVAKLMHRITALLLQSELKNKINNGGAHR
jgi:hypothetical protein